MNIIKLKQQKQKSKFNRKKSLIFCSNLVWKKIFFFKQSRVFKLSEKLIFSRSSSIPKIFSNLRVKIYSGKIWNEKLVNKWMVGFKFGEFTWNRKVALYKAKQLKKKKKK